MSQSLLTNLAILSIKFYVARRKSVQEGIDNFDDGKVTK